MKQPTSYHAYDMSHFKVMCSNFAWPSQASPTLHWAECLLHTLMCKHQVNNTGRERYAV